jgi:antitoxin (DNA-binding transcriptional repressor) of toxin-antitoxin stability system
MKFVSTRELRNRPSCVRELAQKEELVLTANGKPIAILFAVDEDGLEDAARTLRQARALLALSRLRKQAARRGGSRISAADVDREIRAVRSRRKPA